MPDPQYSPAALIVDVAELLSERTGQHIDIEFERATSAFVAAGALLISLGVIPLIEANDLSRAAEQIRAVMLEDQTRTTTRSRRIV